ncbi:Trehalose-6-P synthase/phosphatase complex synthase subunit [Sarracenia purpurea var. burkii]
MHHPSALGMFEQIINASKGKQIVMFLDYDGTLSPIVEDLDRAFMTHEVCLEDGNGSVMAPEAKNPTYGDEGSDEEKIEEDNSGNEDENSPAEVREDMGNSSSQVDSVAHGQTIYG